MKVFSDLFRINLFVELILIGLLNFDHIAHEIRVNIQRENEAIG